MNKKTKQIVIFSCTSFITIGLFGYLVLNGGGQNFFKKVSAHTHSNSCLFNHYEAVDPTEDCHGSKEFWACCSHLSYLLEEPNYGTINEAGPFIGFYFDNLDENDERYIPALPKTRTIKFYCDDLLLDTQYVRDGNKLEAVSSDDFIISGWYKEKELQNLWVFDTDVVDGNINLYSDYVAKQKSFSVDEDDALEVDEYGFSATTELEREICVSKGLTPSDSFAVLENRGILFNKSEVGVISEVTIDIDSNGFEEAKIYYGNTPLSFENSLDLSSGINNIDLADSEYFTIQNSGEQDLRINSLKIDYVRKTIYNDASIPTVVINTKNSQAVTSRTTYVDCNVSTIGADKDVTELKAQIKVRGNSTASLPKKPYRIKLDKKNSLFGYTKAKNWVLLADYMDGSNMHNYTALKFAKMIRNDNSFGVDPLHVNVVLNGSNIGLYTFCEHIDAKEGRLDIEQDNIWEKSFDEINFYVERDLSTAQDSSEIEGVTYFRVPLENYPISQYVFALKYPEKEDFEEELEDKSVIPHEDEFNKFFNDLKLYMTDICNKFVRYYHDINEFDCIASCVDVESLALYAITDQAFGESDHNLKSFKIYRKDGGLLKFGPNWDYDSCAYSLPYKGTYVLNPFAVGGSYRRTSFGEKWGSMLFNDIVHGRQLFNNIWSSIETEQLNLFIDNQLKEIKTISRESIFDCDKWMNNQYFCLLDNLLYYWRFISNQLPYLYDFYR